MRREKGGKRREKKGGRRSKLTAVCASSSLKLETSGFSTFVCVVCVCCVHVDISGTTVTHGFGGKDMVSTWPSCV